jgi:hypothetical protein
MQKLLTFIFLVCISSVYGQTINLKGKITDGDNFPLESATVYLTSAKDSSVVDYTITDKNGIWQLKTRAVNKPVFLKISYIGFNDYKQQFEPITTDKDFGTLKLADNATNLNEVVINSEVPPIRIKSDTLEFNASSFKVRPDSNVETLLKQLPGVDIDANGAITVNGKEVNQILVNGKPFFDRDGKIALKNLPSEIINKVQISDTKTKEEELSGQKATGNNSSINLTIDEDKNKGLFGKFMGGYGTDDRYETSALFNYFKGKQKISVLASSNNINSTGFSMDEIFDSMGGGRNMYNSGSTGISGGSNGITQSGMAGFNYNDEPVKDLSTSISYFYNTANTENNNRRRETTFLPEDVSEGENRSFTTVSESKSENDRYTNNVTTEFEYKPDASSRINIRPKFVQGNSKLSTQSSQVTTDEDGIISNTNDAVTFSDADNNNFSNSLYYNKTFKNKRRSIGISFNNDNNRNDAENYNKSTTLFYKDDNEDGVDEEITVLRNQVIKNKETRDSYSGAIDYFEPITDSLRLKIGANYSWNQNTEDNKGYDFNDATGGFTTLTDSLSYYLRSNTKSLTPRVGITIDKQKYDANIQLGPTITQFANYSLYLGDTYTVDKKYIYPMANVNGRYKFSKSVSLFANYGYNVNFPNANQVLPIIDVSNPLHKYEGNPDLDPNKSHNVSLTYRNFNFATRSGFSINARSTFYDSQVVQYTTIESNAKRNTEYRNVSGAFTTSLGGNWNKRIKLEAHVLRLTAGLTGSYNLDKGYTNTQLFEARSVGLTPRVSLNYDYGELLTIAPSYSYTLNQTDYTSYARESASNYVHRFNLQTTNYWPKHFVFGNDFSYTFNSQLVGFKKDFYLWNTSLGYSFLEDQFLAKVKVYDILNQNLGTSRTIGATSIVDQENTVLKRYVMFSLTYSLKKFGGVSKAQGSGNRERRGGGNRNNQM